MTYDLGFLGGGQLARMSIQAAQRMGLKCLSLDPAAESPASQIAASSQGSLSDPQAIAQVFAQCQAVTLENEFIPAQAITDALSISGRNQQAILPSVETLATIQDKLTQRQALLKAGVPSPQAHPLDNDPPLPYPLVLKARFGGYDGKGTRYARSPEEFEEHRPLWSKGGWMVEEFVPFKRELAVMVVSQEDGCYAFPTMETVQKDHICDLVFPSGADASQIAITAVQAVHGRGIFGVELFELENGDILVNEIAPRPHNTGHYTLDWGGPSQFEAHVRAVLGLPPVNPTSPGFAVMANLLGVNGNFDYRKGLQAALTVGATFVHWYGKSESCPGRKLGHLNAVGQPGEDTQAIVRQALKARKAFYGAACG